jgi:LuxR family maltose regulon positive regulatory protein
MKVTSRHDQPLATRSNGVRDRGRSAGLPVHVRDVKFASPRPPRDFVPRARLTNRLEGSDWRFALVTGGPGTGKTVLAAHWLNSCVDAHRVWITLEADDDRPERFWLHLEAALQATAPEYFAGRPLHRARRGSNLELPFIGLLADAATEQPLVLVLDQLDLIHDQRVLADLAALVEHSPPGVQVLCTTRVDPQLPLASWRARSWLVELRQDDLAFAVDEARALFAAAGEERLSDEAIASMTAHTEGWVAALRLALLSMRDRPDPEAIASSFSGRNRLVADLLVTEVLERQPAELQDFLLRTSILDHLDADLCSVLAERADASDVLRSLEAQVCFVASDDERRSYRYHPLFGELLRLELAHRIPDGPATLHRKAADHLAARGDVAEAIGHFIAAGDVDHAFDLAFALVLDLWDRDEIGAASSWIGAFSPEYIGGSVHRMLIYAFALAACDRRDEGVAWLERALHRASLEPTESEPDQTRADVLRVLQFASGGDGEGWLDAGRRALKALVGGTDIGPIGDRLRPNLARAFLLVDDHHAAAETLDWAGAGDELSTLLLRPAVQARIALRRGRLTEANAFVDHALDASTALGVTRHLGVVEALTARLGVQVERGEVEAALESIHRVREIMDGRTEYPVYEALTRLDEVRVANVGGGFEHGFAVIDEGRRRLGGRQRPIADALFDVAEARWRLETDELRRVEELIGRIPGELLNYCLLPARLALAHDRPDEALRLLDGLAPMVPRDQLAVDLLRARVLMTMDAALASDALNRAVELAVEDGFVLVFGEEGHAVARQARVVAEGLGSPAGTRLAIGLGAPPPSRARAGQLVFSKREETVLRYLPSRLTNREIARECFMSVNTVKTHLKSIYAKLGVSTRSQAIDEARRLNLL